MGTLPNIYEKLMYGGGKVDKYSKPINLKAFYNELHDYLVAKKFKDMLGNSKELKEGAFIGNQVKAGEFTNQKDNNNRTGDLFEKHFSWTKLPNGWVDFELTWQAISKSVVTPYGWYEIKINVVCRNLTDKEILNGNNKMVLQNGTWEFRNEVKYRNNMVKKYLNTIPFVKNSDFLKNLYFNAIYANTIRYDEEWAENKIIPGIYSIIEKHFT